MDIINSEASNSPLLVWPISDDILKSPAVANRNLLAQAYADRPLEDVLTIYVGMPSVIARKEFSYIMALLRTDGLVLSGTGLELGAGIGILSSVAVVEFPEIKEIYAVELVPDVARLLQPRVVNAYGGDQAGRVIPVIGSFDDIRLPSKSCDFCIEYASLHHSDNLLNTLREAARVLKPGAPLLAIDRSHSDALTETQRSFMLKVEYSLEWKQKNGYSVAPLSRADNGEHEIRMSEWMAAFDAAGFDVLKRYELRPITLRKFFLKLMLLMPFPIRKAFGLAASRVAPQRGELSWMFKSLFRRNNDLKFRVAEREHTVFIAVRR